jgi:hypothetical protein
MVIGRLESTVIECGGVVDTDKLDCVLGCMFVTAVDLGLPVRFEVHVGSDPRGFSVGATCWGVTEGDAVAKAVWARVCGRVVLTGA